MKLHKTNETTASLGLGNRILLIDGDPIRRDRRAADLRTRGADVECALNGEEARHLWQGGSHTLILVDLRNSDPDVRKFCYGIRNGDRKQKIGYYLPNAPYLTWVIPSEGELSVPEVEKPVPEAQVVRPFRSTVHGTPEAARRIAALRVLTYPKPSSATATSSSTHAEAPTPRMQTSDAMRLAERILGGE